MGTGLSKSPLERRNTVARRSQRRTIHTIKARVDKVFPVIKKFRGTDKDEDYQYIHTEIEHLRHELIKKSKDIQPQIRNIYDTTLKRLDEAFTALDEKVNENQEKALKKERERAEKEQKKKEKEASKQEEATSDHDVEIQEVEEDAANEADNLEQSTEKRKTVELKFVQVIPDETTQADVHNNNNVIGAKSPEEKRKSILKHGVAVMPGAMMHELAAKANSVSIHEPVPDIEHNSEKINKKINGIIENLQATEYQIADFVGKKHGTQYSRIRDNLNYHMETLNKFAPSDDYTIEQISICRNYVVSCLNFLEEKAIDDEKSHDDVFLPPANHTPTITPTLSPMLTPHLSPIDARNRLDRLSKTTAI